MHRNFFSALDDDLPNNLKSDQAVEFKSLSQATIHPEEENKFTKVVRRKRSAFRKNEVFNEPSFTYYFGSKYRYLPKEILYQIVFLLEGNQLSMLACVSTDWHTLIFKSDISAQLWRSCCESRRYAIPAQVYHSTNPKIFYKNFMLYYIHQQKSARYFKWRKFHAKYFTPTPKNNIFRPPFRYAFFTESFTTTRYFSTKESNALVEKFLSQEKISFTQLPLLFKTIQDFEVRFSRNYDYAKPDKIHYTSKHYGELAKFEEHRISEYTREEYTSNYIIVYYTEPKLWCFQYDGFYYILQFHKTLPQFSSWFKVATTTYLLAWSAFSEKLKQEQSYKPTHYAGVVLPEYQPYSSFGTNPVRHGEDKDISKRYIRTIVGMDHAVPNTFYFRGKIVRGENKIHGTPYVYLHWNSKGEKKKEVSREVRWKQFDRNYDSEDYETVMFK